MFHFQLVALSGKKFDEDVYEVVLPTLDGEIGVLQDHMPLVSVATTGAICVRRNAKDPDTSANFSPPMAVSSKSLTIRLRVLVDEADHADEINEAEAQKALERAQKMKAEAKDQVSLEHAQQLVDRHAVRLQVAGLKRRHQRR